MIEAGPASRLRAGDDRRFTLIELVVVLVIITVVSAIVVPVAGDLFGGTARLRRDARSIINLLRVARTLAVSEKMPREVAFDERTGTVSLRGEIPQEAGLRGGALRIRPPAECRAWAYSEEWPAEAARGAEAVRYADESYTPFVVRFNHLGVSNGALVRLRLERYALRLRCDPMTGRVGVSEDLPESLW